MNADIKIEIIDDETDLCFLLKLELGKNFKEIKCSHAIKDGLNLFKNFSPDWLLLDNNLPDGSGWKHLNEFLKINTNVNVICMSADPESIIDNNLSNVYHFVKPLDINEIRTLIASK